MADSPGGSANEILGRMKRRRNETFDTRLERVRKVLRPDDQPFGGSVHHTPTDIGRDRIVDCYAEIASDRFARSVADLLANPRTRWFEIHPEDEKDRNQQIAAAQAETVLNDLLRESFYQNFQTAIKALGDYGTAVMLVSDIPGKDPWFQNLPLQNTWIDEGPDGMVNVLAREFRMDKFQARMRFGDAIEVRKNPQERDTYSQVIAPPSLFGLKDEAPFISIVTTSENDRVIEKGKYNSKPFAAVRWELEEGEVYGRAPGHKASRSAESLQSMTAFTLDAAEAVVYPSLHVADDGVTIPLVQGPKTVNYVRSDLYNARQPPIGLMPTGQRPDIGEAIIEGFKAEIDLAFHAQELAPNQDPRMTATQSLIIESARLAALGGALWRGSIELLKPLLERLMSIAVMNRMVEPAFSIYIPTALEKGKITAEGAAIAQFIEHTGMLAQVSPDAVDVPNSDGILREISSIMGLKPELLRSEREVQKIRQERAEAEAEARQAENLAQQAAAAQSISQAIGGGGVGGRPRGS